MPSWSCDLAGTAPPRNCSLPHSIAFGTGNAAARLPIGRIRRDGG